MPTKTRFPRTVGRRRQVCSRSPHGAIERLESRTYLAAESPFDVPDGAAARGVQAVNWFGADLYEQLQQADGNLFFSPLSVATALAMTYAGAAGQTAKQFEDVLHLGSERGIHQSFAALLDSLGDAASLADGFELELANAIWPQIGFPIREEFIQTIETDYRGATQSLDYSDPEAARHIINAWVEDKTHGKVEELLKRLSPATVIALTNAIYFKADWTTAFDPARTNPAGQFLLSSGEEVDTPMMHTAMTLPGYTNLDGFKVIEMPLEGERTSMVIALPDPDTNTPNQLTTELLVKIDDWLDSPHRPQRVDVTLPKFNTAVGTQLEDLLGDMGMPLPFTPGAADFSNMTPVDVWIEQVRHKAFIEMNEQGAEAAAATVVTGDGCFAAGTLVLTPDGETPIEKLKAGDYVLSRSESDVEGKIERKVVEKAFLRHGELFNLQMSGKIIRPTKEHPFFVKGQGWTPTADLRAGDLLATHAGNWIKVDKVATTGDSAPVYNLRVADHHTYFVGSKAWGFAIWVHNEYIPNFEANRPFHFFIRDNTTHAFLFMGRIDDPTQAENDLVPTFVANVSPNIAGTVYFDANRDRARSAAEPALQGWKVFVDANRNGHLDYGEPQTISGPDGSYSLTPTLFSGPVVVALAPRHDWGAIVSREVTLTTGQQAVGIDLGSATNVKWDFSSAAQLAGTSGNDTILLRRDGANLAVYRQSQPIGAPAILQPVDAVASFTLDLLDGDDQVIIDYSGGNPLSEGGRLFVDGGSGTNTLTTRGDAYGNIHIIGGTIELPADPGRPIPIGTEVPRISLSVENDAVVRLSASAHLAGVSLNDAGKLIAGSTAQVVRMQSLSIAAGASLELDGCSLIVDAVPWNPDYRQWVAERLNGYIDRGQLRDRMAPNLAATINDRGDGAPRYATIAGDEVDIFSVIVNLPSFRGTQRDDVFHVRRDAARNSVLVFDNETGAGTPIYSAPFDAGSALSFNTLGGNDRLIVNAANGNPIPTGGISFAGGEGNDSLIVDAIGMAQDNAGLIQYDSGTGTNTLTVQNGSVRIDSTVAAGGTLDTTVGSGAQLITRRFRQNELTLADGASATLLAHPWSDEFTSVVTNLSMGARAQLDINGGAMIVNYTGASPEAVIRDKIIEGRGGIGIGNGTWRGTGITSSLAADENANNPQRRSIGYANNGSLPLGAYSTFRGQPLDPTSIVITYTITGDANLDGKVDDNDVTITGASYRPLGPQPHWALGDFDYNGFVAHDDVTLLGALYNSGQAFGFWVNGPPPLETAGNAKALTDSPAVTAAPKTSLAARLVDFLVVDPRDRLIGLRGALSDDLTTLLTNGWLRKRFTIHSHTKA